MILASELTRSPPQVVMIDTVTLAGLSGTEDLQATDAAVTQRAWIKSEARFLLFFFCGL